jgi:hypothetical protein
MPLDCGSTSVSTIWAAIAASIAEPPAWSKATPASLASGCAVATANFRPSSQLNRASEVPSG